MNETPEITGSTYTTNTFMLGEAGLDGPQGEPGRAAGCFGFPQAAGWPVGQAVGAALPQRLQEILLMGSTRIVKVFIADPNEALPLQNRLIHNGEEQLTDLTDQELFFEVPIADLLKKHNELRTKTLDKKQTEKFGRDVFLEPARIRDLKMVVVSIAGF